MKQKIFSFTLMMSSRPPVKAETQEYKEQKRRYHNWLALILILIASACHAVGWFNLIIGWNWRDALNGKCRYETSRRTSSGDVNVYEVMPDTPAADQCDEVMDNTLDGPTDHEWHQCYTIDCGTDGVRFDDIPNITTAFILVDLAVFLCVVSAFVYCRGRCLYGKREDTRNQMSSDNMPSPQQNEKPTKSEVNETAEGETSVV